MLLLIFFRDDQIVFNALLFYIGLMLIPESSNLPFWRTDGVIITALLHAGPVEFLYYWLHRALHHHFLYSRYHSHHHSSIVTEPITCVFLSHLFTHLVYFHKFYMLTLIDHSRAWWVWIQLTILTLMNSST